MVYRTLKFFTQRSRPAISVWCRDGQTRAPAWRGTAGCGAARRRKRRAYRAPSQVPCRTDPRSRPQHSRHSSGLRRHARGSCSRNPLC